MVKAPNGGPFTLDGTRSYLVGRDEVALIDPGPDMPEHVRALSDAVGQARTVRILLTHRHRDHAGAATELERVLSAEVLGPPSAGFGILNEGESVPTDDGELKAVDTPGHTADHLSFHWPRGQALFVGDLVLGIGATTWVGEYAGCVADYLVSLGRVRKLDPAVVFPGHGPPIRNVASTLDAFEAHRMERLAQVRRAMRENPEMSAEEIAEVIYGGRIPRKVADAARASVEVMVHHLSGELGGES
jgi:glyoxylase-like metal-dependent hydrolase (beta-lactamase superfamily II)